MFLYYWMGVLFWNVCETFVIYREDFSYCVIPFLLFHSQWKGFAVFHQMFASFQLPIAIFFRNLSINSTHNIKDSLPHIIQHTIYYLSVYWILLCGSILVGIKALYSDLSIFEYNSISINKHFFRFLLP